MRLLSYLGAALLTMSGLLASTSAFAQAPTNDRCSTARAVTSGTFVIASTTNANDDIPGLAGCQTTNVPHPDVWFSFPSSTSRFSVIVTPDVTAATLPYEILVFSGTCGAGLIGLNDKCVASGTDSLVVGGQAGQVYYVVIASPSAAQTGDFFVQIVNRTTTVVPAQDCINANIIPTGAPIVQGPLNMGAGTNSTEVDPNNSCWGSGGERQPKWYKFIAGVNGKLTFNINPNVFADDYDWAVWDITSDPNGCTTKGDAIACNWSGSDGSTGLSLCPNLEPNYLAGANTYDNTQTGLTGAAAPITLQAGRIYALLVDNFSQSSAGFTLTFGGACPPPAGQPNPLTRIGLDAQFDLTKTNCNSVSFRKRTPVDPAVQPFLTYEWRFGDGQTSNLPAPTHTYSLLDTDSTYQVQLRITVPALRDPNNNRPLEYFFSQQVRVAPPRAIVTASVDTTQEIDAGTSVTLTASGAEQYNWSGPGITQPSADSVITVTVNENQRYRLIYTSEECSDTTEVLLRIAPPRVAYNIITPNGDGKNDTFSARVSALALELKVYNRWGRKVYEKTDYQQDWNGGDLASGTYYYHIKAADGKTWKGWLEIVK
jgi:gliding motility-associated-like protein